MANLRKSDSHLNATAEARAAHARKGREGGGLLGSISVAWGKHRNKRGRSGRREAAPVVKLEPTSAAPTPERQAKEVFDWQQDTHPGGQVSHWAKSAVEEYRKHFTEEEVAVGRRLIEDAELTTKINLICGRTYSGAPYLGASIDAVGHLSPEQRLAHERFNWVIKYLGEEFKSAAAYLVLGVRSERMGKPMSPKEFAAISSRYDTDATKNAFTAGFLKATLRLIGKAYRAWASELLRREEQVVLAGGPAAQMILERRQARRQRIEVLRVADAQERAAS